MIYLYRISVVRRLWGQVPLMIMKKLLLCVLLIVFARANFAFAKTYDISQISQAKLVTEYDNNATFDEIDTVLFGSYPQTDINGINKDPIEWFVLEKRNDKILLFSKYCLDVSFLEEDTFYENSSVRKFLNNDFFDKAFEFNEKNLILESDNWNDKLFLLQYVETLEYFGFNGFRENGRGEVNGRYLASNAARGAFTPYSQNKMEILEGTMIVSPNWFTSSVAWDTFLRYYCFQSVLSDHRGGVYVSEHGATYKTGENKYDCVRPALWISTKNLAMTDSEGLYVSDYTSSSGGVINGLPSQESELRSDNKFYLNNSLQKDTWVYYQTYYYHVGASGDIHKSRWIELRYVGEDGRMYRGRQTPDGKWVGDDGLVVDIHQDLYNSTLLEAAEPDSWYKTQSGLWYYFENDRTTTKKGWFTDARDNQIYYLDPTTGIMAVGWTNIGGSWYYFNESHNNEKNWYATGGGFYESYGKKVRAYGSMFRSETTPDGKQVDANGKRIQ